MIAQKERKFIIRKNLYLHHLVGRQRNPARISVGLSYIAGKTEAIKEGEWANQSKKVVLNIC